MLTYIIQGLTLGAAAGAQPGPFQAYLISQSIQNGWRRTVLAAFAPLVSDGVIIALVLLVLTQMPIWFERILNFAGGTYILYLAWSAYRAWQRFDPTIGTVPQAGRQSLLRAALMNALSPNPYIYWSLVTGPILLRGWEINPFNGIIFLLGFYVAMISINMTIIVISGAASESGNTFRRGILGLSALALCAFGFFQLWQGAIG